MSFSHPMRQKFPVGSLVFHQLSPRHFAIHLVYEHREEHVLLLLLYREGGMANQFKDFDDLLLNYRDLFPLLTGKTRVDAFKGYNQTLRFHTLQTHRSLFSLEEMLARGQFLELDLHDEYLLSIQRTLVGSQIHPLPKTPANGL